MGCDAVVRRAERDYVEQVARALKARGVRCFYDADLDDSGCRRGLLLIVLCRFSAVGSGWRVAVLPDVLGAAPAPTAPGGLLSGLRGWGGWSGGCRQGAQPLPAG